MQSSFPQPPNIDISFIDFQDDPLLGKQDNFFTYPQLYSAIVRSATNKENYKFVEIGAWKGRSAAYMGAEIEFHSRLHRNKYKITLDAIDTFCGSEEHKDLLKNEEESLYDICKRQIQPVSDYVNLIKGDSVKSSDKYEDESLDFVFIDGDHSYDGVMRDIEAYFPKIRIGGVIAGHDYEGGWVDCKKAVDDFFNEGGLEIPQNQDNNWNHEYEGKLNWPAGELCWGVIKTSKTDYCTLLSKSAIDLVKKAASTGNLWCGQINPTHDVLLSLYNLKEF